MVLLGLGRLNKTSLYECIPHATHSLFSAQALKVKEQEVLIPIHGFSEWIGSIKVRITKGKNGGGQPPELLALIFHE